MFGHCRPCNIKIVLLNLYVDDTAVMRSMQLRTSVVHACTCTYVLFCGVNVIMAAQPRVSAGDVVCSVHKITTALKLCGKVEQYLHIT